MNEVVKYVDLESSAVRVYQNKLTNMIVAVHNYKKGWVQIQMRSDAKCHICA